MTKQLYYSAPINTLGYGQVGFNFLKQLISNDCLVDLYVIGKPDPTMEPYIRGCNNNIDIIAPSLRIWHQNEVHPRVGKGDHYGFPIFELETFSSQEVKSMNLCDSIITCSQWGADIVKNHIKPYIPVHVVPLGVDTDLFTPVEPNENLKTIFLNVGKWEIRKGHDFLLEAFKRAFGPKDPVELWLLPDNPFLNQSQLSEWMNLAYHPKIRVFPRKKTHEGVFELMSKADVGVFPSRAEGWNLELLEMMSIGKPMIATNYSAHTEFCNKDNCNLIDIDSITNAYDGIWFHNQGKWANLGDNQMEQLIYYMRTLHDKKQQSGLGVNINGVNTGLQYSWINSVKKLLKKIE